MSSSSMPDPPTFPGLELDVEDAFAEYDSVPVQDLEAILDQGGNLESFLESVSGGLSPTQLSSLSTRCL